MPTRAVVFDLDGTLVDSLADLGESMNAVLEELVLPQHPLDAYRRFVGDGIRMLVLRALPESARSEDRITRAVARMREVYSARWDVKTRPYVGIGETLASLTADQFSLAVLSNKPHAITVKIVERYFLPATFSAVLGAEAGFPRKPAATGAIELARRLAVRVEDCFYVGDTATDMQTARAARMYAIGALWGFRDAEELLGAGANALAEQPKDIFTIVHRAVKSG